MKLTFTFLSEGFITQREFLQLYNQLLILYRRLAHKLLVHDQHRGPFPGFFKRIESLLLNRVHQPHHQ